MTTSKKTFKLITFFFAALVKLEQADIFKMHAYTSFHCASDMDKSHVA